MKRLNPNESCIIILLGWLCKRVIAELDEICHDFILSWLQFPSLLRMFAPLYLSSNTYFSCLSQSMPLQTISPTVHQDLDQLIQSSTKESSVMMMDGGSPPTRYGGIHYTTVSLFYRTLMNQAPLFVWNVAFVLHSLPLNCVFWRIHSDRLLIQVRKGEGIDSIHHWSIPSTDINQRELVASQCCITEARVQVCP